MYVSEKVEAESLIKNLPAESTFEDIQYHLYVAKKLQNARQEIKEGKTHSQADAEKKLIKWIRPSYNRNCSKCCDEHYK